MCNEFIDQIGDRELFRRYLVHNTLEAYTNFLCYNTGVRGICQGQKRYHVPDKIRGEDIFEHKHSRDARGDDEDGEGAQDDYADDYEEDYNEDDYSDNESNEKTDRPTGDDGKPRYKLDPRPDIPSDEL